MDEFDVAQWEEAIAEAGRARRAYAESHRAKARWSRQREVVEVVFTPWPYDADGNDQSRVSVSAEDAWILFTVVTSVEDLGDEEAAAADRLALALRSVR
jgi:hypothetical protein